MATDERNFRSAYYEKVGFRSVEEKKSLEILLKDRPLDRGKLRQFCLRFSVPGTYRNLVWKLLQGVVHVHTECHQFIMDQRKQEYNELLRALNALRVIEHNTPKPQLFLAMWVLQSGNFTLEANLSNEKGFLPIVQSFIQFFDDDVDIFWLSRSFYNNVKNFEPEVPKLIECTHNLLEKEDAVYHKLLITNGLINNLPLTMWFGCCFAGVLNESALAKVWDKVYGGSYKILAYVAAMLLINLRHRISTCNNVANIVQHIKNMTEEAADVIANKSIEMWQHAGSPLTVYDKPKP